MLQWLAKPSCGSELVFLDLYPESPQPNKAENGFFPLHSLLLHNTSRGRCTQVERRMSAVLADFFFFHQPHPEIKRLTDKITMTWNNSKANRSTAVALVMFHVFAILLWQGRKYFQRNSWKLMSIKHLNDSVTFPGVWRLGFLFPFLCEILHRRQKHTAEAVSGEVALSCTVRKAYISCL